MKYKLLFLMIILIAVLHNANGQWYEMGGINSLHANGAIHCLAKDSAGNIFAAGKFRNANGKYYVAKWDGKNWSEVGGTNTSTFDSSIMTITTDIHGYLYAAGNFTDTSGNTYVAKWDGNNWSELGIDSNLYDQTTIQYMTTDSLGNLYVTLNQTSNVGKWDGTRWNELWGPGGGASGWIILSMMFKNGILYTVGDHSLRNGIHTVAQFDGNNWTEFADSINTDPFNDMITSIITDKQGHFYVAGYFDNINAGKFVSKYDGNGWSELGGINTSTLNSTINSLAIDAYSNIYAGGYFTNTAGKEFITKWDGTNWTELGGTNGLTFDSAIQSVMIDNYGNVLAAGNFKNTDGFYFVAKYGNNTYHPSPSLSIDLKDTTSCSYTIEVPVRGKGIYNVSKLSGSIGWDTTYLNFGGVKFAGSGIVMDSSNLNLTNVNNGKLGFNWSDTIGYSMADSMPIITLTFYPHKNFSGGTGVWFDSIPQKLKIDTALGIAALKASFNDGWVLLNDTPLIIQSSNILQCYAGCVPIHYQWYYNGNPVTGDTLNYITADSIGLYTVTVTYINGNKVSSLPVNIVLPVILISFNVQGFNEFNTVNWQTSSEINTAFFHIQRSTNGKDFNSIGIVQAKGAGTYSYNDPLTIHDSRFTKLYYRLEIIDNDGRKTFSEIKQLTINNNQVSIVPNPAKEFITIKGNHISRINITDITGRQLNNQIFNNAINPVMSLSGLSTGIYYVTIITSDNKIETRKLMKE